MKLGFRTPNLKSRVKARTTGKVKRKMKRSVNPLHGKKGMGLLRNPKKSIYNRIYRRTTISADKAGGLFTGILNLLILPFTLIVKLTWLVLYFPLKLIFYYPYILIRNAIRNIRSKSITAGPNEDTGRDKNEKKN